MGSTPSVQAQAELADRTCTTFDELVALSQKIGDGLRAVKVTIGKADRYTKAKSVRQLGSGSGAKAEPILWAAPPATMPEATPPQGRPLLGRPPPQQPFQAFAPTPPTARTPSYGTEPPRAPRSGAPTGLPAMVPLSQVQCHRCRRFRHYARACPSPDRAMGPRAPLAAAPGSTGADRPALRPNRMQYATGAVRILFSGPMGYGYAAFHRLRIRIILIRQDSDENKTSPRRIITWNIFRFGAIIVSEYNGLHPFDDRTTATGAALG